MALGISRRPHTYPSFGWVSVRMFLDESRIGMTRTHTPIEEKKAEPVSLMLLQSPLVPWWLRQPRVLL